MSGLGGRGPSSLRFKSVVGLVSREVNTRDRGAVAMIITGYT